MTLRRVQKLLLRAVPDVELAKPVRQGVVVQRVLGVQPLAIHHIALVQQCHQRAFMGSGPLLVGIELALAPAHLIGLQIVGTRLQQQTAVGAKAQRRIGAIELFLDHDMPAGQGFIGHGIGLITDLQPRATQMRRARIFEYLQIE